MKLRKLMAILLCVALMQGTVSMADETIGGATTEPTSSASPTATISATPASTDTQTSAPTSGESLSYDMNNDSVKKMQERLNELGYLNIVSHLENHQLFHQSLY